MADYSTLKAAIAAALPENTEGEITATKLVQQLDAILDGVNGTKADNNAGPIVDGTGTNSAKMKAGSNVASGDRSFSVGSESEASGTNAAAFGRLGVASGLSSMVQGQNCKATAWGSHAQGGITEANGKYSHSEGNHTVAGNESEHAEGVYNVSREGVTRHSVGVGSSSLRKNAFEITNDGKVYVLGAGGYEGTAAQNLGDAKDIAAVLASLAPSYIDANAGSNLTKLEAQIIYNESNGAYGTDYGYDLDNMKMHFTHNDGATYDLTGIVSHARTQGGNSDHWVHYFTIATVKPVSPYTTIILSLEVTYTISTHTATHTTRVNQ